MQIGLVTGTKDSNDANKGNFYSLCLGALLCHKPGEKDSNEDYFELAPFEGKS